MRRVIGVKARDDEECLKRLRNRHSTLRHRRIEVGKGEGELCLV